MASHIPGRMANCSGFRWTEEVPGTLDFQFFNWDLPGKSEELVTLRLLLRKQKKNDHEVSSGLCRRDTLHSPGWK